MQVVDQQARQALFGFGLGLGLRGEPVHVGEQARQPVVARFETLVQDVGSVDADLAEGPGPAEQARGLEIDAQAVEREQRLAVGIAQVQALDLGAQHERVDAHALQREVAAHAVAGVVHRQFFDQQRRQEKAGQGVDEERYDQPEADPARIEPRRPGPRSLGRRKSVFVAGFNRHRGLALAGIFRPVSGSIRYNRT